jgi:hypothetical protein
MLETETLGEVFGLKNKMYLCLHLIIQSEKWISWAPVAHACNPSYLGG